MCLHLSGRDVLASMQDHSSGWTGPYLHNETTAPAAELESEHVHPICAPPPIMRKGPPKASLSELRHDELFQLSDHFRAALTHVPNDPAEGRRTSDTRLKPWRSLGVPPSRWFGTVFLIINIE